MANYYFTKNKNQCLMVEYNKKYDFGKHSDGGCRDLEVIIHYQNSWVISPEHEEIKIEQVPDAIRDVLTYLK
nr:hypothetical protein [uncultured Allomuricauda sp.]